ncbi:transcription initiation factor IIA subunit 1 [Anopheles maculipalpis]|uniref:transcription initiation factor IIA subunit 1 n=1 Tax=Anopheles maculipalpis TaxID=1496333 RepID=UPI00215927A2|nr:transcription initiation factor IIA subunit 1 [Anopheles maculipalpis]
MSLSQTSVLKVYTTVIDDVIAGVRDAFLDEGVDEQVLQEMKQVWTTKLLACKAIESTPESQDQQNPSAVSNKSASHAKTNGTKKSKAASAAATAAAASNNQQENGKPNNNTKANPELKNANVPSLVPTGNAQPTSAVNQNSTGNTTSTTVTNTTTSTPQQQQQPQQQQNSSPAAVVSALDPDKQVAIQITLPAQPNVPNSQPRVLTIQVPASALQENQLHQVLTSPIISSIMPLPPHIASNVLQQHVNNYLQNLNINTVPIQKQLDGACDEKLWMGEGAEGEVAAIHYKLVELPPKNSLDRYRLDRQLINALVAAGAKSTITMDDNEPIASGSSSSRSSSGINRSRSKVKVKAMARTARRRPLKAIRESRELNGEDGEVSSTSFHICSSLQLDGAVDTSDEEGSDISDDNIVDDDDEDLDKEEEDDLEAEGGAEEEPLNSEDDVTDEDASDLFDTDNVVVCQYDKITRSRNKWKFYLKDGIMHIGGKDYVFQKSNGDAEW